MPISISNTFIFHRNYMSENETHKRQEQEVQKPMSTTKQYLHPKRSPVEVPVEILATYDQHFGHGGKDDLQSSVGQTPVMGVTVTDCNAKASAHCIPMN